MSRYERQVQLAEVGALGQARLGQLALVTPSECSSEEVQFARLYAQRCGLRPEPNALDLDQANLPARQVNVGYPTTIAQHYKHAASAAVGVGAAVALTLVVTALFDPR